jgi:hypothetical protein
VYKTSAYWNPDTESAFAYDDPELSIAWPAGLELTASARDAAAPRLSALVDRLRDLREPPPGPASVTEQVSR